MSLSMDAHMTHEDWTPVTVTADADCILQHVRLQAPDINRVQSRRAYCWV